MDEVLELEDPHPTVKSTPMINTARVAIQIPRSHLRLAPVRVRWRTAKTIPNMPTPENGNQAAIPGTK
jgi:hypothetical protein